MALLLSSLAGLAACKAKSPAATGVAGSEEAKAVTMVSVKLPTTGLDAQVPEGSRVSEALGKDLVDGPGLVATVESGATTPRAIDEAKREAEDFTAQAIAEATLDDGWVLTFENEGSMGPNYWVQVRRELEGEAFFCSTTADSAEVRDAALAFCKSLKKSA